MPLVNAYATVPEVRTHLGDAVFQKLDLELLERAINAASRAVDHYTGRRFWQDAAPVDRTYRPTRTSFAYVDDISTETGLVVATDDDLDGTFETEWTAGTDYLLDPLNVDAAADTPHAWTALRAVGSRRFRADIRPSLQVTAQFGWSAVPEEIAEATILKAVALFQRKNAPFGVAGFGEFGAVRITREDSDVVEILQAHVRLGTQSGVA